MAEGVPALAIVDVIEMAAKVRIGQGPWIHYLKYTYAVEQGTSSQLCIGEQRGIVPTLGTEVRKGQLVMVLYDPLDVHRNEVDCFDARREDRLRLLQSAPKGK